jgi:hypothetical protein
MKALPRPGVLSIRGICARPPSVNWIGSQPSAGPAGTIALASSAPLAERKTDYTL